MLNNIPTNFKWKLKLWHTRCVWHILLCVWLCIGGLYVMSFSWCVLYMIIITLGFTVLTCLRYIRVIRKLGSQLLTGVLSPAYKLFAYWIFLQKKLTGSKLSIGDQLFTNGLVNLPSPRRKRYSSNILTHKTLFIHLIEMLLLSQFQLKFFMLQVQSVIGNQLCFTLFGLNISVSHILWCGLDRALT